MHMLSALVFNYSLDGLLAAEGTPFWTYVFDLLDEDGGPDHDDDTLGYLDGAAAHLMGRTAYEGMSKAMTGNPDNPWAGILERGRKVVFSRTLQSADWPNTTIASGDTATEIDALRRGGDGHIVVWGGVRLWRSLMQLDLVDEWRVSLYPYVTGEGTRLFGDVPPGYRLELVTSVAKPNGILELQYRRPR